MDNDFLVHKRRKLNDNSGQEVFISCDDECEEEPSKHTIQTDSGNNNEHQETQQIQAISSEFGENIRKVWGKRAGETQNQLFFAGKDCAKLLQYKNTNTAIATKVSNQHKVPVNDVEIANDNGIPLDKQLILITEFGLYQLIFNSQQEASIKLQTDLFQFIQKSRRLVPVLPVLPVLPVTNAPNSFPNSIEPDSCQSQSKSSNNDESKSDESSNNRSNTRRMLKDDHVNAMYAELFPYFRWQSRNKVPENDCRIRRRPDYYVILQHHILVLEVDENQHKSYQAKDETIRINQLSESFNDKPVIYVRFNPDKYKALTGASIKGCFKKVNDALVVDKQRLENRLMVVHSEVTKYCDCKSVEKYLKNDLAKQIYLFYDGYDCDF